MRRRDLVGLITGAIAGWPRPLAASGQDKAPVIGCLSPVSPDAVRVDLAAFRRGLSAAGFVEGRNVTIEYRWARGQYDRLPSLAADLAARRVDVILASSVTATFAAKAATTTIPIVFITGVDPVASGLVTTLSHPGGNLTGVAILLGELWPKRLELLHELVPTAVTIGVW